jgi:hypothetical protein
LLSRRQLPRARHGGARFSEKHANFVENEVRHDDLDVLEPMAEAARVGGASALTEPRSGLGEMNGPRLDL